jgi:microcystin-dependent protein
MPGAVIPDLDGVEDVCVRVTWPNSEAALAILRGQIVETIYTDYWDANTGDVDAITLRLLDLLEQNLALEVCEMIPLGEIRMYAGDSEDNLTQGWVICDGRQLSQSQYASLYAVLATSYNTGGESEGNFRIPNFVGKVPAGVDSEQSEFLETGTTGGAKTVTLTTAQIPSHNHQYRDRGNNLRTDVDYHTAAGAGNGIAAGAGGVQTNRTPLIAGTGGGGSHNNLQPYLVVNFIVYIGLPES